jgi:PAS domain S-box-containing protein
LSDPTGSSNFLVGEGEMARLVRATDWSKTALGPIGTWPQSLLTTVSLCLASNFPINIIWGPEASQIYNDGYRVVCGEAHPRALGEDYRVTWASAWPAIGLPFETARAGETSFLENQRMFLTRNGYLEETFFTFSLSPIRDESGGIGGLFHPVTETTASMLAERRTRALRDLTANLATASTVQDIGDLAVSTLTAYAFDLPFGLMYGLDDDGDYQRAAVFGVADGPACPERLSPGTMSPWPVAAAMDGQIIEALSVRERFGGFACGPYEEAPDRAFLLPLGLSDESSPHTLLILGVSPRLPLDDAYRGFFELIGAAVGAALTQVRRREEERNRAEALAAIDRAKTAFFSNVSHEFRTPLTLMLGPLEDALNDHSALASEQRERLDVAYRNALRLLKLVNALLDFSRVEAGRVEAKFEPVDLAAITADLASNFRSACERAGLDLVVDCPPLDSPFYLDREMWEKVVLNLVSNAFKFTLHGRITVALRQTPIGARLSVSDTGVGIPAGEIEKVFDRFHRIEGQSGRTHEGSGIGLSLVRELVALHGGAVGVSSTEGHGATFTVDLMAGCAHLPADRVIDGASSVAAGPRANAFVEEAVRWIAEATADQGEPREGRPRVLLADDNADMRDYVRRILDAGGYAVETVARGDEALAAAKRAPHPDLVLSDVMMPGLDGFELVAALRADPALDGLPIVLLSARAGEEARVEGLSSGADDYLLKPFSARELRARIDGVIRLARQRAEAAGRERDLHTQLATEKTNARLQQTESELAYALQAGRLGSWSIDMVSGAFVASEICRATFGLAPDAAYDRQMLVARIHPDDRERRAAELSAAIEDRKDFDLEYRILPLGGGERWVLMRGKAAYDDAGKPVRMNGVSLDITERKRAEDRQKLLLDELNHRVKNTLATVQSIAMQTRRNATGPQDFNDAFDARLAALANAHDLLTRTSWQGVSLSDMVKLTLQPYANNEIEVAGPAVLMGPNAAVTLNMAFHELATNAAKYGALSREGGSVDVNWSVDRNAQPPAICVEWSEARGPLVQPPVRRGFGSRVLEQGIARELGGAVSLDYRPAGLKCRMTIPLSHKIQAA